MRAALAGLLLVACGAPEEISEADYPFWGAQVLCERTRECMRGSFDAAWYSMDDCRTEVERDLALQVELMDNLDCDYSARQAANAYDEIAEMTCERFYEGEAVEASNDIWDDCIGFTPPPYTTYQ